MPRISKAEAKDLIKASKGKIFTAKNIKKDGSRRVLNGRLNVQKGVKGLGLGYNPDDFNMMTVFDMQKENFRMLNVDTMYELSINKEKYEVV